MSFQSLLMCLFFSIFSVISHASQEHPAVFKTSLGLISTVEQYKERVNELYPTYTHEFQEGLRVDY